MATQSFEIAFAEGFPLELGRSPKKVRNAYCREFFPWYNTEHRHGGLSMLTPHDVHHGLAHTTLARRQRTLEIAWAAHPERFVRGRPNAGEVPDAVWINPPEDRTRETAQ